MNATAPSDYKTAGTFMLISGITTVLTSLALVGFLIWFCIGALWIPSLVVGIIEIVVGSAVMSGTIKANAKTTAIFGIVGAFLCGNIIGLVLEILAVIYLGKPEVEAYIQGEV